MSSGDPLTLKRETLAQFLPSLEAIIAFEGLFGKVYSEDNEIDIDMIIAELTVRRTNTDKLRLEVDAIKRYLGI